MANFSNKIWIQATYRRILREYGISKYMVAQLESLAFLGLTHYFDVTGVEKKTWERDSAASW
jgi:hypothetical protein